MHSANITTNTISGGNHRRPVACQLGAALPPSDKHSIRVVKHVQWPSVAFRVGTDADQVIRGENQKVTQIA